MDGHAIIRDKTDWQEPNLAKLLWEYTNASHTSGFLALDAFADAAPMRIGINSHKLSFEAGFRQAGTSRYIEALLQELPGIAQEDEIISYTGSVPDEWVDRFPRSLVWKQARFPTGWPPARILWEQTAGIGLGRRDNLDVLHSPLNIAPVVAGAPSVVTVHDIAFERFPGHYPAGQRRYLSIMTKLSTRRASQVIAVSGATRDDLVSFYGIDPGRITVIHNGVESIFREHSAEEQSAFRAANDLPDQFILFVGTLQPRKNLDGLLRAYALIADRIGWPLVVIGGAGWLYSPIHRVVRNLGLSDRVRFTGYVEPADLPQWYAAAAIFAFPSHYEGFGLPVVESMASGTPVVTSATSSLPEVAGDAALLVDPSSPAEIAGALLELAENSERRRELARRGVEQSRRFSWRQAAAETHAVYKRAYRESRSK